MLGTYKIIYSPSKLAFDISVVPYYATEGLSSSLHSAVRCLLTILILLYRHCSNNTTQTRNHIIQGFTHRLQSWISLLARVYQF